MCVCIVVCFHLNRVHPIGVLCVNAFFLSFQSETQSQIIQLLPISGPDPLPFKISSGNLVVRDDPELNQTVDNYELVWEAQNDNGSTSWAYTNIGEPHKRNLDNPLLGKGWCFAVIETL